MATNPNDLPKFTPRQEWLDQQIAAAMQRIESDNARAMWPVNVNAALQALAERVLNQEARIARLEAGQG